MQDYHIAVCSYYQSLGHDVRVEWKQSIILTLILADLSVPIPTLVEGILGPRAIEIEGKEISSTQFIAGFPVRYAHYALLWMAIITLRVSSIM